MCMQHAPLRFVDESLPGRQTLYACRHNVWCAPVQEHTFLVMVFFAFGAAAFLGAVACISQSVLVKASACVLSSAMAVR